MEGNDSGQMGTRAGGDSRGGAGGVPEGGASASSVSKSAAPKADGSKRARPFLLYLAGAFVLTAILTALVTVAGIIVAYNVHRDNLLSDTDLYAAFLVAAVVSLAVAVVVGMVFASGIARPVELIARTAESIKEGDLSARTGLSGQDELSRLGQIFDEMADSIERDRDLERQLIGDVAHELRTPLMGMQATIEGIQDGVLPADDEHLSTLAAETGRLGRLVEALLHLNRLENGTVQARKEQLDLSGLVADLVLTQEAFVESMGLDFEAEIEPGVLVVGDRDLMTQVVVNLMSNAVRYTPEGGSVRLSLARSGGNAHIAVGDTGIGISEDDIDKVFSRFWRADEARQRTSGGLGIGLALVREVVDQHHGSVQVESELGRGSTFTVVIPLAPEDPGSRISTDKVAMRKVARAKKSAAKKELDRARREQRVNEKAAGKARRMEERARRDLERQQREQDKQAQRGQAHVLERDRQSLSFFGTKFPLALRRSAQIQRERDGGEPAAKSAVNRARAAGGTQAGGAAADAAAHGETAHGATAQQASAAQHDAAPGHGAAQQHDAAPGHDAGNEEHDTTRGA